MIQEPSRREDVYVTDAVVEYATSGTIEDVDNSSLLIKQHGIAHRVKANTLDCFNISEDKVHICKLALPIGTGIGGMYPPQDRFPRRWWVIFRALERSPFDIWTFTCVTPTRKLIGPNDFTPQLEENFCKSTGQSENPYEALNLFRRVDNGKRPS